ncbi:MAG: sugar ABC transporter permease, partial [Acutalibacteraceae bacterium]|nr:sugar ABC transporter permease [Acutalibacteraceae bacterium]
MKEFLRNTWQHRALVILALPVFLIMLFMAYLPMSGLVLAFEEFDYTKGIFGSPLIGLKNFEFLLQSKDTFIRMLSNTLMYYVIFTFLGQFLNVVLAIGIDQFAHKNFGKIMQTVMIMPVFVSYAAVQFIVMAYLSSGTGIINNLLGGGIPFYRKAEYWPYILTIVKMWNGVGYGSVL